MVVEFFLKSHGHVRDVLIKLHVLMFQFSAGEDVICIVAQQYTNCPLKALWQNMTKMKSGCFASMA